MGIIKKVRSFVSWLLFERLMGKESAETVAKRIIAEVNDYNRRHRDPKCQHCGAGTFISKLSGSDGLFSSVKHFYECTACGNQQRSNGSSFKYDVRELRKCRIIKDGDSYRYYVIGSDAGDVVSTLVLIGFGVMVLIALGLMIFIFTI